MTLALAKVESDDSSAWFRTLDGAYDVLGEDLNCTGPVAAAAGAGPVWGWRPAQPTRAWRGNGVERWFGTKKACLADLQRHIASQPEPAVTIETCANCGQRNRVRAGVLSRCGRCKTELAFFIGDECE